MQKIELNDKTILVTGSAGFIGSNLVMRLFNEMSSGTIVGIDNLNDYYDVSLKEYRLQMLDVRSKKEEVRPNYHFIKGDISDKGLIKKIFAEYKFDIVVNLAAQAGVRYSIENPDAYIMSNMIGFYNILEACRKSMEDVRCKKEDANAQASALSSLSYQGVQHLVYASSSSVYGGNKKVPFSTDDRVDNPVSLYAATKKSNELMAHCYSKLYNIPSTGLRFFTVYGPAGRPDMAYFGFTNKLLKGETIQIFNYGNCRRDFTYVDDIVEGIVRVMQKSPASPQPSPEGKGEKSVPLGKDLGMAGKDFGVHTADPTMYGVLKERACSGTPAHLGEGWGEAPVPYAVYNIGGGQPENLLDFVNILQEELVRAGVLPKDYDFDAHKQLVPMQPGDVPTTYADATALERDFGFTPRITLREGLRRFAEWYKSYYGENEI